MRVLKTGGDGFIGSHLTNLQLKNGYGVRRIGATAAASMSDAGRHICRSNSGSRTNSFNAMSTARCLSIAGKPWRPPASHGGAAINPGDGSRRMKSRNSCFFGANQPLRRGSWSGSTATPRESRELPAYAGPTTGASWSDWPIRPCFVSVQNARKHGQARLRSARA
jgi:hypothetical protein